MDRKNYNLYYIKILMGVVNFSYFIIFIDSIYCDIE